MNLCTSLLIAVGIILWFSGLIENQAEIDRGRDANRR